MNNSVCIQLDIDTTDSTAALGFELWLDSVLVVDIDHVQGPQNIQHLINDDDGEHELKFVLKNKTAEHTKIDQAGNIVQDARLIVNNVKIDDIELGHNCFTKLAKYHHSYNTDAEPVVDTFYTEMGCNGHVVLNFSSPVYLWLLDNI